MGEVQKVKLGNITRTYFECGDYMDQYPNGKIVIHIPDPYSRSDVEKIRECLTVKEDAA